MNNDNKIHISPFFNLTPEQVQDIIDKFPPKPAPPPVALESTAKGTADWEIDELERLYRL
jgi:hypothetical protein